MSPMKIKKILFIANENILVMDDPAFQRCMRIVERNQAQLCVVTAIKEEDIPGFNVLNLVAFEKVKKDYLSKAHEQIKLQIPMTLIDEIEVKVLLGVPFVEIIRESVEGQFDIVVKSREIQQEAISSLDLHLLRKSQIPLFVEKKQCYETSNKMICAIDLSLEQNESGQEINNQIMSIAHKLSDALDLEILILSCWNLSGEESLHRNPFLRVDDLDLANLTSLEETKNKELMKSFLHRCGQHEHLLIKGEASHVISQFMNTQHHNILVMGTFSRTGIPGYLIGNTAENIILTTHSSMITVKPAGFVSPVLRYQ